MDQLIKLLTLLVKVTRGDVQTTAPFQASIALPKDPVLAEHAVSSLTMLLFSSQLNVVLPRQFGGFNEKTLADVIVQEFDTINFWINKDGKLCIGLNTVFSKSETTITVDTTVRDMTIFSGEVFVLELTTEDLQTVRSMELVASCDFKLSELRNVFTSATYVEDDITEFQKALTDSGLASSAELHIRVINIDNQAADRTVFRLKGNDSVCEIIRNHI